MVPKDQEEIPNINPDLHAVGVGVAIIGGLDEFYIRLIGGIHIRQFTPEGSWEQKIGDKSKAESRAYSIRMGGLRESARQ